MTVSAKSVWKGALNVGLLNLNVKLYKATDDYETGLRELHASCSTPTSRNVTCPKCDVVITSADILKGARQPDGTYVTLTAAEVKSIKPESSDVIAVTAFVPLTTVDPLYVEDTHYLMPDGEPSRQAYATLVRGLIETQRVAQARFCIYGRERTVTLRVIGSALVVQSMRDANHVRDLSELPGYMPTVKVDSNALKLVTQLIDMYAANEFDPSEFEDEHAKALTALIDARKNGEPLPVATAAAPAPAAGDLMAALKASLGGKPSRKAPVKVASKTAAKRKKAS
jgi:DNA end-binding protein Ku